MPFLKDIHWKALIFLTVFTANLYAVCQCHHKTAFQPVAIKSCCTEKHRHQEAPGCPDKNGCRNDQSVKFSLLDKQAVEKLTMPGQPEYAEIPAYFTTTPTRKTALPKGYCAVPDWQYQHAPPDLHSLYQRFLI